MTAFVAAMGWALALLFAARWRLARREQDRLAGKVFELRLAQARDNHRAFVALRDELHGRGKAQPARRGAL